MSSLVAHQLFRPAEGGGKEELYKQRGSPSGHIRAAAARAPSYSSHVTVNHRRP